MNDERLDCLIDQHLSGALVGEERRELEERLLHSASDRARFWQLSETHVLIHAGMQQGLGASAAQCQPAKPSLAARVGAWFHWPAGSQWHLREWLQGWLPSPKQAIAMGVAVMAVVAFALWFTRTQSPSTHENSSGMAKTIGTGEPNHSVAIARKTSPTGGFVLGSNLFSENPNLSFRPRSVPLGPISLHTNVAMVTGLWSANRTSLGNFNQEAIFPAGPGIR